MQATKRVSLMINILSLICEGKQTVKGRADSEAAELVTI